VRIDDAGDIIWSRTYGAENQRDEASSILETTDGDFIIAGESNRSATALLIDRAGEPVWESNCAGGRFNDVIELPGNELVFCGGDTSQNNSGYLVNIVDGEVHWESSFGDNRSDYFTSLSGTEDGIFISGTSSLRGDDMKAWVINTNLDGQLRWSRFHRYVVFNQTCSEMVPISDNGYVLACNGAGFPPFNISAILTFIDQTGDTLSNTLHRLNQVGNVCGIVRLDEGELIIAGFEDGPLIQAIDRPFVISFSPDGEERWRQNLFPTENGDEYIEGGFYGITRGHNNSIIAVGFAINSENEEGDNGLVIKFEPGNGQSVVGDSELILPEVPVLFDPAPNPFNSTTHLSFYLPRENHISLSVHDTRGREVAVLFDGIQTEGHHKILYNANKMSTGMYFVQLETNGFESVRKVVLVR
ncbi:MAG: T9SS type A sorting domain-containing protein, partial [Calditrichaeota bacterium]|nr:T9SS type A sorting domain-containing protein [Calditrichota bacterium]